MRNFDTDDTEPIGGDAEVTNADPLSKDASDGEDWEICADCDDVMGDAERRASAKGGAEPDFRIPFGKRASQKVYVGALPCSCFFWAFLLFLLLMAILF